MMSTAPLPSDMSATGAPGGPALENICRVKPEIPEIMAEMFAGYRFMFGNEEMLPFEVFSPRSFLPVISHIACQQISDVFALSFTVNLEEDDTAILGFDVRPDFRTASALFIYLSALDDVARNIFGTTPGVIDLNKLYDWALSDDDNVKASIPYLGVKS